MIRSTRRQQFVPGQAIGRQPLMGSPAQVWTARAERVLRELSGQPAYAMVAADAEQVVMELRLTAGQVADLDHGLALLPVPSLEQEHSSLTTAVAAAEGTPSAT